MEDDDDFVERARRAGFDKFDGRSREQELVIALAAALRPQKSSSKEAIYNTLIVAAIVALVGAVWTLRESVTTLQVTLKYVEQRVDKLEHRP